MSIIGTLSGVIFGFFLNNLYRKGQLKLIIKSPDVIYVEPDGQGGGIENNNITDKTDEIYINLDIDIYNSSQDFKSIRHIRLKIYNNKIKETLTLEPIEFEILNIPPKNTYNQKLSFYLKDNFNYLENSELYLIIKQLKKEKKYKIDKNDK